MVFTFLGRLSLTRQCGMVVFLVKWAFNIHSWFGLLVYTKYTKTRKVDKFIMIKPTKSNEGISGKPRAWDSTVPGT